MNWFLLILAILVIVLLFVCTGSELLTGDKSQPEFWETNDLLGNYFKQFVPK